ncbi:MAG: ATP-binding protein [Anaerolineae bacterium]|jgi:MinD superfamily P-loop ATPase
MIIAVASGKGGTGKTTVATSLAQSIAADGRLSAPSGAAERARAQEASQPDQKLVFLDCDVEEPNAALFLQPDLDDGQEVGILIPDVDYDRCTFCGRCAEVCPWHAIAVVGRKVLVFPELCHGCGSCTLNCPEDAIHEVLHVMGVLESGPAGPISFGHGILNVGEAMAVPIIRQLKARHMADNDVDLAILDASPGTSCPVVETMRGADFVLLVTEPTPFGLHDLRLAAQVARDELGLPVGVVVNRDGVGDTGVEEYCAAQDIPILMRIPIDRRIAEAISGGQSLVEALPEYRPHFIQLYEQILGIVSSQEERP